MEANEIVVMKDAARRMQDFLSGRGIKVGHAVALEALSASLGARNWRTVRDKLSAPAVTPPAPAALALVDISEGRWTVRGRDFDGGVCGDYFDGDTPLDAKIQALYRRMYDDGESTFKVDTVIDRLTDEEVDYTVMTVQDLDDHSLMFRKVLLSAQEVVNYLHLTSNDRTRVAELQGIVTTLQTALSSEELRENLVEAHRWDYDRDAEKNGVVEFARTGNAVFQATVDEALVTLEELLEEHKGRLSEDDLQPLYQFKALMEYFGDEVRQILTQHFSAP